MKRDSMGRERDEVVGREREREMKGNREGKRNEPRELVSILCTHTLSITVNSLTCDFQNSISEMIES